MPALGNWVKMAWSSGTTGALTLTKSATYPSFNELLVGLGFCAATNTNVNIEVHYTLVDETNGTYEAGIGTFNPSTNILTRTAVAQTATTSGGVTTVTTKAATAVTAGSTFAVYLGTTTNSFAYAWPGTGYTGTQFSSAPFGNVAPLNIMRDTGATTNTATLNQEVWAPILWPSNASLKALTFRLGAGTTGNFQFGIYEMLDTGAPGVLLWDSGSYAPTASAVNTRNVTSGTPTAVTLHPGWYWAVFNGSASTLTYFRSMATMTTSPIGVDSYGAYIACFTRSKTQGTLDATGPALSALTASTKPNLGAVVNFLGFAFTVNA